MDSISKKNGDGKDGKDDDLKIAYLDVLIKDDTKIYSSCNNEIQGFKGYMVKKSIIKPILNVNRPVLFPADCPQSIMESNFLAFFIDFALPTFILASKPSV